MNTDSRFRLLAFAGALILVSAVACTNSVTDPAVAGERAARDTTTGFENDSTLCRSGWVIMGGRTVCL